MVVIADDQMTTFTNKLYLHVDTPDGYLLYEGSMIDIHFSEHIGVLKHVRIYFTISIHHYSSIITIVQPLLSMNPTSPVSSI